MIKNVCKKIRNFFKKKRNIIIVVSLVIILLIVILLLIFNKKNDKFALNSFYNNYPVEVRKLYSNIVSVSCSGDLHLNISLDEDATAVSEIDKNDLLNYMFSYLDKNSKLSDKFDIAIINDAQRKLFLGDVKPFDGIKTYDYGNYTYTIDGRTITRKVKKCTSDNEYVTFLYGGSFKEDKISMDVNVGYKKDGILYDYNDTRLGEYDGDVSKLSNLMSKTTFYRFIYIKQNGVYKLASVQHKSRT